MENNDLLLLGMFSFNGFPEELFHHSPDYTICYNHKIAGGYCFIRPPDDDYSFREFERMPDGSIVVPSLIEAYEEDCLDAAASSAISTNFSSSDVPEMRRQVEIEILMKSSGTSTFWLPEPMPYETNAKKISYLKKDLVDLLRSSDGDLPEQLFSELRVYDELYHRGILVWGEEENVKAKREQWAEKALAVYDGILAKFLQTGKEADEIGRLKKGISIFCSKNPDSTNFKTHIEARIPMTLRGLIANSDSNFEHIANLYFNGNSNALRERLDRFKKELLDRFKEELGC
ncbi:hypothetical protein HYX14_05525 [Candidatus Woesearchaeota archaeon]|nr:hypothetical protein [Candidatus Woesearchaeota archaeon]